MIYKKLILLFLLIVFGWNMYGQSINKRFEYTEYLEYKATVYNVYTLIKEKKYQDALINCNNLKCNGLYCREKQYMLGLIYFGLNNKRKSKKHLLSSIALGIDSNNIKVNLFGEILPISDWEIQKAYQKYLSSFDTTLRKRFFNNYKNPNFLYNYIQKNGWPGINQLGHEIRCDSKLLPKLLFITLSDNQNDSTKLYYSIALNHCELFNEEWNELENFINIITQNEINKRQQYIPLNYIFLDENNEIDYHLSLMPIAIFAKLIISNYLSIELYFSSKIEKSQGTILLKQIENELIKFSVNKVDIKLSSNPVDINALFCFKIL